MKDKIKELIKSGEHEDMIDYAISNLIWVAENFSEAKSTPIATLNKLHDIGFGLKKALTPKKKPVDMSVLVDSPIDCEFWHHGSKIKTISQLKSISKQLCGEKMVYEDADPKRVGHALYCKPRMDYPFSVDLFSCQKECHEFINILDSVGFKLEVIDDEYFNILNNRSFKIIGLKDGYCWPWECE